jgi:hypothetical protein
MARPKFLDDEAFKSLRSGEKEEFNNLVKNKEKIDFTDCDLRATDFRDVDLSNVVLKGAYLRDANLRGQDLRQHDLEGCSIFHAHISGVFWPRNLSAEEIRLSLDHGTRMRTIKKTVTVQKKTVIAKPAANQPPKPAADSEKTAAQPENSEKTASAPQKPQQDKQPVGAKS